VDPKNIDILMGTFTKSFGSVGGYIAGSKVALLFAFWLVWCLSIASQALSAGALSGEETQLPPQSGEVFTLLIDGRI
jgi:7-keto-8-aminopelargonate synthetase-like enzyme